MGEREKHVVVERADLIRCMDLGVDGPYVTEQNECLIDEVTPEVEQRPAAGGPGPAVQAEPLKSRLESDRTAQEPVIQRLANRSKVGVPPAVLVDGQWMVKRLGEAYGLPGGVSIERERLVGDNRQAEMQRPLRELDVRGRGCRDGHRLGARRSKGLKRGERRSTRELVGKRASTLR